MEGESSVCCRVPANQVLLRVTGSDPTKGYSVTVSASNGAGEGEESMPIFATCEFCSVKYTVIFCEGKIFKYIR